ncbi:DUF2268 domain-containing protein [Oceanobacillus damuensis]|uniref:DUF2268 domain-containing protein n=1 Tax=Oceanobacillus damuensis TaxID=937928 RepID=UPI00082B6A20|nr:DUF2268 domain-containing protein [Oceanobacillus damuensis]
MGVIQTDEWLLKSYDNPIELCKKLEVYFNEVSAYEIYDHLRMHGMYRPINRGKEQINLMKKSEVWAVVQEQLSGLKERWNGPEIPVFIFPSDTTNRKLTRDFNGKSGLAFKDKLLLFISAENERKEIEALLTHEYNHACRLNRYKKNMEDYCLLDTIILEGMAEYAVQEQIGEEYVAGWTKYYTDNELKVLWEERIFPHRNKMRKHPLHDKLLYGFSLYPKMLGYSVGYYLIMKYTKENKSSAAELFTLPSEQFIRM